MRRIKNPKIGEYVLLTRWSDRGHYDPWELGFLKAFFVDSDGKGYKISERWYRNCFRLTKEEGHEWMKAAKGLRHCLI